MSDRYKIRRFRAEDAEETAALIAETLRTVNIKDYSKEIIEANVVSHSADVLLKRAGDGHMYVVEADSHIVGCGAIAGYWGSVTESWGMTIKTALLNWTVKFIG